MTPSTALLVWLALVVWLFVRDRALRRAPSAALWIPTLWAAIIGSRPVSIWFGASGQLENPDDYLEGSPVDRMVFQGFGKSQRRVT